MDSIRNENFMVYYAKAYGEYANRISVRLPAMAQAVSRTLGVDTSGKCSVYILDSMYRIILHPKPLPGKLLMLLMLPVWYRRAKKAWDVSAGWTLNNYKERAFGVKTADELRKAAERNKNGIYTRIYDDIDKRAEYTACHEMAHAFTSHLRLPLWFNEGIAQYAAEEYAGKATIREETLEQLKSGEKDGIMEAFLCGYFIVKHIEKQEEGAVASLLKTGENIDAGVAGILGVPQGGYKEYIKEVFKGL